jgi:hypothetical protein
MSARMSAMLTATRVIKIDPRPTAYDSVAEATFASQDEGTIIDTLEPGPWAPVRPEPIATPPRPAFVDGVERRDARVSAEGDGAPLPGLLVSYAAGAVCIGREPALCHVSVQHRVVIVKGARTPRIAIHAANGPVEYLPAHNAGEDAESLDRALKDLRAALETEVVRALIAEGAELIVVDGRLPPVRHEAAVGLIKTPHRLPVSLPEHLDVLARLRTGERSPVFVRTRSDRAYYSWFVCLQTPGPLDLALSGLAMLEMDDETPRATALRVADVTAATLPAYAPAAFRDPRAPQNLIPVGQLERELRHHLGDPELLRRLLLQAFAKEVPQWAP